jgi:hypothetical protein
MPEYNQILQTYGANTQQQNWWRTKSWQLQNTALEWL